MVDVKFTVLDVMDKGAYLVHQLEAAGHERGTFPDVDLLLLDCDWSWANPRPQLIAKAVEAGVKVAVYPHGGQATFWVYDGLTKPDPGVDLRFEHGPRAAELAERLNLTGTGRFETFGWLYSPTAPFEPVQDPYNVLFAPLHPNIEAMEKGGPDIAPKLNQGVYKQLLDTGFQIGVTAVGPLWRNGIWPHPRATIVPNPTMRLSQALELVAAADVVVAAGTLAAAAVALGKPTVFLDTPDCCDYLGGKYVQSDHAAEIIKQMRYPLVVGDGPLEDLIRVACQGSEATAMWRDWWVGDDGTPEAVRSLGHLVGGQMAKKSKKSKVPGTYTPQQKNVTIQGARAEVAGQGR